MRSKPLRYESSSPVAPRASRTPSSVELTSVSVTLRAAATLTIVSVRQPASACSRNSAGFGASLWPNRTGGSLASTSNGSSREASSWPAPQKPWIVERLCGPSIQRLVTRNSNRASSGCALSASSVP